MPILQDNASRTTRCRRGPDARIHHGTEGVWNGVALLAARKLAMMAVRKRRSSSVAAQTVPGTMRRNRFRARTIPIPVPSSVGRTTRRRSPSMAFYALLHRRNPDSCTPLRRTFLCGCTPATGSSSCPCSSSSPKLENGCGTGNSA